MSFCKVVSSVIGVVLVARASWAETAYAEHSTTNDNLVQEALARGCAAHYDLTCLKLDALKTLNRFSTPTRLDLAPGISVERAANATTVHNASESEQAVERALASAPGPDAQRQLDAALLNRVARFLDAHSLHVRLLEMPPVAAVKDLLTGDVITARRRKNQLWPQLLSAGMMMGGSTLTMGLAALAAMAGKALMLSMLSLVLSALTGMGGNSASAQSQKQTTYEIISKPVYTHGHTHSAELHHEPSGPAAYGIYGRSKDTPDNVVGSTGASGVGGAVNVGGGVGVGSIGPGAGGAGATGGAGYLSNFPRSLQESSLLAQQHRGKKPGEDDDKATYDGLLIRNLNEAHNTYRQNNEGVRGGVSYSTPQDLVPSESDYATSQDLSQDTATATATVSSPRHKYTTDSISRSFQLEEESLPGSFVVASPRGLPLPHLYVGEAEESGSPEQSPSHRVGAARMRPLVYRAYGDTLLPVNSK